MRLTPVDYDPFAEEDDDLVDLSVTGVARSGRRAGAAVDYPEPPAAGDAAPDGVSVTPVDYDPFAESPGWGDVLGTGVTRAGYRMGMQAGGGARAVGEHASRAAQSSQAALERDIGALGEVPADAGGILPLPIEHPEFRAHVTQANQAVQEAGAASADRGAHIHDEFAQLYGHEAARVPVGLRRGWAAAALEDDSKFFVSAAVETLFGNVLPTIAVGIATRDPTLALTAMGGQVYAEQYGAARARGRSEDEASMDAAFFALSETITERIPLGIVLRGGERYVRRILKSAGAEGLSEIVNQAMQMTYGGLREDQWPESFQEALRELVSAGIIGTLVGGSMAAAVPGGAPAGTHQLAQAELARLQGAATTPPTPPPATPPPAGGTPATLPPDAPPAAPAGATTPPPSSAPPAAGAVSEELHTALRESVRRTGRLPQQAQQQLVGRVYDALIDDQGYPRGPDTLEEAVDIVNDAGGDVQRAREIWRELFPPTAEERTAEPQPPPDVAGPQQGALLDAGGAPVAAPVEQSPAPMDVPTDATSLDPAMLERLRAQREAEEAAAAPNEPPAATPSLPTFTGAAPGYQQTPATPATEARGGGLLDVFAPPAAAAAQAAVPAAVQEEAAEATVEDAAEAQGPAQGQALVSDAPYEAEAMRARLQELQQYVGALESGSDASAQSRRRAFTALGAAGRNAAAPQMVARSLARAAAELRGNWPQVADLLDEEQSRLEGDAGPPTRLAPQTLSDLDLVRAFRADSQERQRSPLAHSTLGMVELRLKAGATLEQAWQQVAHAGVPAPAIAEAQAALVAFEPAADAGGAPSPRAAADEMRAALAGMAEALRAARRHRDDAQSAAQHIDRAMESLQAQPAEALLRLEAASSAAHTHFAGVAAELGQLADRLSQTMPDAAFQQYAGIEADADEGVLNAFADDGRERVAEFDSLPRGTPFPTPANPVNLTTKAGAPPVVTEAEARTRLGAWRRAAQAAGEREDNSNKVVFSLFDRTGVWSRPWEDAGYRVVRYDIESGDDLVRFFPTGDIIDAREKGYEIAGVLLAPPCTSFAVSGARWWESQHDVADKGQVAAKYGLWAAQYFDRPLDYANTMVRLGEAFVGFAHPGWHAMENPIGRIASENDLPAPLLTWHPHHYGSPYTKKTQLWGAFNPELPTANVEPTQGSLIHRLRGDVEAQKSARSVTPEGFAYAFFLANHPGAERYLEPPAEAAQERVAAEAEGPAERFNKARDDLSVKWGRWDLVDRYRLLKSSGWSKGDAEKFRKLPFDDLPPAVARELVKLRAGLTSPPVVAEAEAALEGGDASQTGAGAPPAPAPAEAPTQPAKPVAETPADPAAPFAKGDRVVIATSGRGEDMEGRHGVVTHVHKTVWRRAVLGFDRAGVSADAGAPDVQWGFDLRTDSGASAYATPDDLRAEDGEAPEATPDLQVGDEWLTPQAVLHRISIAKRDAKHASAKNLRARKPEKRAEWKREAERYTERAQRLQSEFDAWAQRHPEAAAALDVAQEAPAPTVTTPAASAEGGIGGLQASDLVTHETRHAKKHIDLFVAAFTRRVERDVFARLKSAATRHGGYYSSYKARGAVPGFQFERAGDRQAFIDEVLGAQPAPASESAAAPERPDWQKRLGEPGAKVRYKKAAAGFAGDTTFTIVGYEDGGMIRLRDADGAVFKRTSSLFEPAPEPTPTAPPAPKPGAMPSARLGVEALAEGRGKLLDALQADPRVVAMAKNDTNSADALGLGLHGRIADVAGDLWQRGEIGPEMLEFIVARQREGDSTVNGGPWAVRLGASLRLRLGLDPETGARQTPAYGAGNRVFTAEAADQAREVLRKKLRGQLNAGLDPELLQAGITLAGYHVEAGARSYVAYTKAMVEDMGAAVQPYLRAWYEALRQYPGFDTEGMTSYADIEAGRDGEQASTLDLAEADDGGGDGLPSDLRAGDARPSAADVHGSPPERPAAEAPRAEDGRGVPPAGRDDGARAAPAERSGEGSGSAAEGGAHRAGDDAGLPDSRAADAVAGHNHHIEPGALAEERGAKAKARDNLRALELLQIIEDERRPATAEEQAILARYVGWGGLKGAFPDQGGAFGKGYEEIGARLRNLLTDAEYQTAQRSIQYAHYTSETVIDAMWRMAARLGFTGGSVYEPGMGIGHFAGLMPPALAAVSRYHGVEMDGVTARIAALLYPRWGVQHADFTRVSAPLNTHDLAIGNPPFASVPVVSDARYKRYKFLLHDYFFAKSMDSVRPGGLLVFVTSAGTMNKHSTAARQYLAERADLIGAVRLPSTAFARNAGTEITTDILILRKHDSPGVSHPAAVPREQWVETTEITAPGADGKPTRGLSNRYFVEHPQHVLGQVTFADKLYEGRYAVHARKGADLAEALAAFVDGLPVGIMERDSLAGAADFDAAPEESKEGSYYLRDGQLYQLREGKGVHVSQRTKGTKGGVSKRDYQRVVALIPVRDALREVYAADLAGDAKAADAARRRLNKSYDAFVEQFGPINLANLTYRRPSRVQLESARAAAREEARYVGDAFSEGSFDAGEMLRNAASMQEIAKARAEAREAAQARGEEWDEGTFDPDAVPDTVIDKRPNIDPFMGDQEAYRLRAIEHYDEGSGEARKGRVFFESVVTLQPEPQINSVGDAMLHVLNVHGRVDLAEIAAQAQVSETHALRELGDSIFERPDAPGVYEPRDDYLSGNVLEKLAIAEAAAAKQPRYRRNVLALRAVQPDPLPPSRITARLGMPWIPTPVFEEFAEQALEIGEVSIRRNALDASWRVVVARHSAGAATYGTPRVRVHDILTYALSGEPVKVYDTYEDKTRELNVAATEAAQDKVRAVQQRFEEWVYTDESRADRLAALYNAEFNNTVPWRGSGDYLTTPGVTSSWSWYPHQRRVIARILRRGNTYMAHAVGAGKTSAMIGAGMEMRRLGLARKPMYVVPNHMLAQFTKEFYEQYPTARIAVADEHRFHTARRKQFIADVAASDLDGIIITHSSFGLIPLSDAFLENQLQRQLKQFQAALAEVEQDDRITRSNLQAVIERLEQRIRGLTDNARRDQVFTFEELGVDFLFIDEAHFFRKLSFPTRLGSVKGVDPLGSAMSQDLYFKTRYLETLRPGRSLVLASGTPVTNTMAELYSISRYLQPEGLEARGIDHFDAWSGSFGATHTEYEPDPAGNYKAVTRFARFVNVPELSALVRDVMDVISSKELATYVTRPALKGGKRHMVMAERSAAQAAYQQELASRLKAISQRSGRPKKGDDIVLTVATDGRHAAIDMRFIDNTIGRTDPPSKLDLLVDRVYETWEETRTHPFYRPLGPGKGYESDPYDHGPATQMVFADLGVTNARGFSSHQYLVSQLVQRGIPRAEIALIGDYKSHAKRQQLFNDMNEGRVRVLIGSVGKMGTGVNAQRRLYVVHNLDPVWQPALDEQRNGRGLRQGNHNREIVIYDYSTQDTYDVVMWQTMERKARFIEAFFSGDATVRDMDDLGEASVYEQAKAMSISDPRLLRLTELRQSVERLERSMAAHQDEQFRLRQSIATAETSVTRSQRLQEQYRQALERRVDTRGDAFRATLDQRTFTDRTQFGEAQLKLVGRYHLRKEGVAEDLVIGSVAGFDITLSTSPLYTQRGKPSTTRQRVVLRMGLADGLDEYVADDDQQSAIGLARKFTNIADDLERALENAIDTEKAAAKRAVDFRAKVGATFPRADELADQREQLSALQRELFEPEEAATTPAETRPKSRGAKRVTTLERDAVGAPAWREDGPPVTGAGAGRVMFSQGRRRPRLADALRLLAENDELWQLRTSEATTLAEIAADVAPGAKVEAMPTDDAPPGGLEDDLAADLWAAFPQGARRAWALTLPGTDGKLSSHHTMVEEAGDRVWISAALMREGGGGSTVYAIVGNYARNTGKVFIADPGGFSIANDGEMPGALRRTDNMLSLALKFGTTAFMEPGDAQRLDWRRGDDAHNIEQLALRAADNVRSRYRALERLRYDEGTGTIRRIEDDSEVTAEQLAAAAVEPGARAARAGRASLARAVLIDRLAVLFEEGQGGGDAVLEGLASLAGEPLGPTHPLRGAFYSRTAGGRRGLTVGTVEAAIALDVLANSGLGIGVKVVPDFDALPAEMRAQAATRDIDGAWWAPERTVYLVAEQILTPQQARVAFAHEAVGHAAMDEVVPEWPAIVRRVLWMERAGFKHVRSLAQEAAERGYERARPDVFVQEMLAIAVERRVESSAVQRVLAQIRAAVRAFLNRIGVAATRLAAWEVDRLVSAAMRRGRGATPGGRGESSSAYSQAPGAFYSQLERVLAEKLPGSGQPGALADMIDAWQRKGEFKPEEAEWVDVVGWLRDLDAVGVERVPRDDVVAWVRAHAVEVTARVRGAGNDAPADNPGWTRADFELGEEQQLEDEEAIIYQRTFRAPNGVTGVILRRTDFELGGDTAWGAYPDHPGQPEHDLLKEEMRETSLESLLDRLVGRLNVEYNAAGEFMADGHPDDFEFDGPAWQEMVLGGFGRGARNYREVLLTLPERDVLPIGYRVLPPENPRGTVYERQWLVTDEHGSLVTMAATQEEAQLRRRQAAAASAQRANFTGSHFNVTNVLAHMRVTDRTAPDGSDVLFIEEMQSDWHQQGAKQGYKGDPFEPRVEPNVYGDQPGYHSRHLVHPTRESAIAKAEKDRVPPAPFRKTWPLLAFKQALRMAVELGADAVAWPGDAYTVAEIEMWAEAPEPGDRHWRIVERYTRDLPRMLGRYLKRWGGTVRAGEIETQHMRLAYEGPNLTIEQVRQLLELSQRPLNGREDEVRHSPFADGRLPKPLNTYRNTDRLEIMLRSLESNGSFQRAMDAAQNDVIAAAAGGRYVDKRELQPHRVLMINITDSMREAVRQGQALFSQGRNVIHMGRRRKAGALPTEDALRAMSHDDLLAWMQTMDQNGDYERPPLLPQYQVMARGRPTNGMFHDAEQPDWGLFNDEEGDWYHPESAGVTYDEAMQLWRELSEDTWRPMPYDEALALALQWRREMLPGEPGTVTPLRGGERGARFSQGRRPPAEQLGTIERGVALARAAADRVSYKLEDWRPGWLALLTRRQLGDVGKEALPEIVPYIEDAQRMDAERSKLVTEAAEVAQRWGSWAADNRQLADETASLMHDATLAGADPSEDYAPVVDVEKARRRIRTIRKQAKGRSGEGTQKFEERIARLERQIGQEHNRLKAWPTLVRRWEALPLDARALFVEVRDFYAARFDATERALLERIDRAVAGEEKKRALKDMIRWQFEQTRVQAPYFPLARFGDYWISAERDGERQFSMFESAADQAEAAAQMTAEGWDVRSGKHFETMQAVHGASASFVADVIGILEEAGGVQAEKAADAVYQLYLASLPELSVRRHFIHRGKVPGFSRDALRAFAHQMFHGSYQLARLRYADTLERRLAAMREALREHPDNKASDLFSEIQKRHEWAMNPVSGQAAHALTSLGFAWYLGLAPATALVNVTQTPLVAAPVIAARHGWPDTSRELLRAQRDFVAGGADVTGSNLTELERRVIDEFMEDGTLDRTLAHDLAGQSETPSAIYNPVVGRVMHVVSFMFHHAERMNREVTALAAYRLARRRAEPHTAARRYARDVVFDSHFDYGNANKARFMQSDTARVLLLFRQYSQNMTYLLVRSAQQSLAGESASVRREARRRITGILVMHALAGGALGLPILGMVFGVLNAVFGDDDDPYDAEAEFRAFLVDVFGEEGGRAIAKGPLEALTGIEWTGRVGLGELWFRGTDRDLDGRGTVEYWVEQLLGPIGGIVFKAGTAYDMISEGHIYRGIEAMLPKFARDVLRAGRYTTEGVNTLRGDPVVEDLNAYQIGLQAIGFTPAEVALRWDENRAAMNAQSRILHTRARLMNRFALAQRAGDQTGMNDALERIRRFNARNPTVAIGGDSIARSLQQRARFSAQTEQGVRVDPRLRHLREEARFGPAE